MAIRKHVPADPAAEPGTEHGAPVLADEPDAPAYVGLPPKGGRHRTALIPLLIMTFAAIIAAAGLSRAAPTTDPNASCVFNDARSLVPTDGVLFGVNIDWEQETLEQYRSNLGKHPAAAVQFSDIPYDRNTWSYTVGSAGQVKENGGVLILTLEPHGGLDTLSDSVIQTLVTDLKALNDTGVPVVVRLAHEMNGTWYAWGQQPTKYVDAYRRVAAAVHAGAPGSSMMWAPNYGGGYPFLGGQYAAAPGTADFTLLNTDHDGRLTMNDDPYAPYYPGDDSVDWVGISLYHWGNKRPWGDNEITEPTKFADMLSGDYKGTAGDDGAVPNFYDVYGVKHAKPVAIVETAAIYTPSRPGASESAIKQAWWQQVFSEDFHRRFPQVKMINWFERKKYEIEIKDAVDWRAAGTPAMGQAFAAALPTWVRYADSVTTCTP